LNRSETVWRVSGLLGFFTLAIGIGVLALNNLGNHYFWTDESSSFFAALGWPGPGMEPGGFDDINQSLKAFLDPGLFHYMIRGWTDLFGYRIEVLRALPFIFFLLYVVGLLLWSKLIKVPLIVGVGIAGIMMLENITPYYSVEVRAYSGTQAAAVLMPLIALVLVRNRRLIVWIPSVISLLVLGSMQFGTFAANVGTSLILAWAFLSVQPTKNRWRLLSTSGLVFALLPLTYLVTRGNPFAEEESQVAHVDDLIMRFQSLPEILGTLQINFLSLTAIPRTAFLVLIPLLLILKKISLPSLSRQSREDLAGTIWIYIMTTIAVEAIFSLGGFLPWVVGTRWSILDISTIALSIIGLVALAFRFIDTKSVAAALVISIMGIAVVGIGAYRLSIYERQGNQDFLSYLIPEFLAGESDKAIIDYWISPDTRYWIEYSGRYPDLTDLWIAQRIQETSNFETAGAEQILEFLNSDNDRLLLKSENSLIQSGIELPNSIVVLRVPTENLEGIPAGDAPILLIKNP
jgi:hypothetical protein